MDNHIRDLERRWHAGDTSSLGPLRRAQCRGQGHTFGGLSVAADEAQAYATATQSVFEVYRLCSWCFHEEWESFKPGLHIDSTAGTLTWTISTDASTDWDPSWASTLTIDSYDYDAVREPVGTLYHHPTKGRAWAKRAHLSKKELRRRRRQRRCRRT